ncbi:MAG: hypothetical protein JST82_12075 [Bacteroidetes bacterium]|nr:hypothetical protein [Bacteroidota bacterium]
MYKKASLFIAATVLAITTTAQTTYLQLNQEDYTLLDQLETRSGSLSDDLFLFVKPVSRKSAVNFLQEQRRESRISNWSDIDLYNISHAISVSGEWALEENGAIDSKRPILKTFYKKQPDFIYVNNDNFFFSANPIITATGLLEKGDTVSHKLFTSSRGLEARGMIAHKVGFYTMFTDNQEGMPTFASDWADSSAAVPGQNFYTKKSANHYDYLQARGYIDFALIKDHINVTFGYDKHFLGDGMTSLFLSDFSSPTTFLRLNTRVWKFNYQNLYMELYPQFRKTGGDNLLSHKYATMHHLSINALRWLNIGIFEGVIFDRRDRYEFSYMVPIILYREIERSLGSPDNVVLGLNFKAIALKHIQLYGQLLLDEFTSKELIAGTGYWANKFGIQLGGKYFDAFGAKNLMLQGEINLVRPYTYSHYDSTANYTHYNQPLAHPLGAGFAQMLGVIKYQPVKNLYISLKAMYYKKGVDTGGMNYGGDIFKDYDTRAYNYGVGLINGVRVQCASLGLNISYELKENLFIDLGGNYRKYAYESGIYPTSNTTYVTFGFRLNLTRRDYDFY